MSQPQEKPQAETALTVAPPKEIADVMKPALQAGKLSRLAAFTPTNLTEAIALSKLIANSDLVPKDFKGKAANVLIAMQMGAELGVAPMQALANIAVINGRAAVWGDLALAIVQVHPSYEWHKEWFDGQGDSRVAYCQIKRKGHEPHTQMFTVTMARQAKLWGKKGYRDGKEVDTPWITSPDRMLQMRARGFCLRDKFADALRGLILAEEAMDITPDTSDTKRKREEGTLDVGATISDLAPSAEPNRGHGNEGMQKTAPKQDNVMCAECRQINGHADDCPQKLKEEQDRKTSKPTVKTAFLVLEVKKKTKRDTGAPYLILEMVDNNNHKGKVYVWHQSLHQYLEGLADKPIMCEISEQRTDKNTTYHQLEHILEIAGQVFVNDKPAEQAPLPLEQVPQREAGDEDL